MNERTMEGDATAIEPTEFQEQAAYEKGFAAFFDKEIQPMLADLERKRLEARATARRRMIVAGVIITAVIALGLLTVPPPSPGGGRESGGGMPIQLVVLICFVVGGWAAAPGIAFRNAEKGELLPKLVRFFGDFSYTATNGLTVDSIRRTQVVTVASGESPECAVTDTLTGTNPDVGVRVSISRVRTGIGSGKSHRILFDGELILAEMPRKRFPKATVVRPVGLGEFPSTFSFDGSFQKVDLEDPGFAARYEVWSQDQVEARYVLTPDVMERLLAIDATVSKIGSPRYSFSDDTLCIALGGAPSLYDPAGVGGSAFETADIRAFLERMHHVLAIVAGIEGTRPVPTDQDGDA